MNPEVSQGQREEVIKTAISKSASMMSVIYDIRDVAYFCTQETTIGSGNWLGVGIEMTVSF